MLKWADVLAAIELKRRPLHHGNRRSECEVIQNDYEALQELLGGAIGEQNSVEVGDDRSPHAVALMLLQLAHLHGMIRIYSESRL